MTSRNTQKPYFDVPQNRPAKYGKFEIMEHERLDRFDFHKYIGKYVILDIYGYPQKALFEGFKDTGGYNMRFVLSYNGNTDYEVNTPMARLFGENDNNLLVVPPVFKFDSNSVTHPFFHWDYMIEQSKKLWERREDTKLFKTQKKYNESVQQLEQEKMKWLKYEKKYPEIARLITGETIAEQNDRKKVWQGVIENSTPSVKAALEIELSKLKMENAK
jgi:hypothetical protein